MLHDLHELFFFVWFIFPFNVSLTSETKLQNQNSSGRGRLKMR